MNDEPNFNVFKIILTACLEQDSLCMDVSADRRRLASAITAALQAADVLAQWAE